MTVEDLSPGTILSQVTRHGYFTAEVSSSFSE